MRLTSAAAVTRALILALPMALSLALAGCPGDPANRAPSILSPPPAAAWPYEGYTYDLACADPDGDMVTLTRGPADTCGGTLVDHGNRMGSYAFEPAAEAAGTDCVVEVVCDDGALQDVARATVTVAPLPAPTDLSYGPFEPWAEPIADYISEAATAIGSWSFYQGIHELAVHDHRLYIGYGDATHNVGSLVDIEIRAWQTPDPDAIQTEYVTAEEQIDKYRQVDGRLLIPGIDATEDGFMGQVYTLEATGWATDRTVPWAWHVQDVTIWDGELWACGSGGTADDYANGTVNAYLYHRTVDATGFFVDTALPHPQPPGDHRLTKLLAVGSTLYALGYWSDYDVAYATAHRYTGSGLAPWDEMASFWTEDTLSLGPDLGLVFGVAIETSLRRATRVVTAGGVTEGMGLAGLGVIDADPLPQNHALILALQTDAYPTADTGPWDVVVGVTTDGQDFSELVRQSFEVLPRAIAFWRRSLYLGLDDGTVWRAWGAY